MEWYSLQFLSVLSPVIPQEMIDDDRVDVRRRVQIQFRIGHDQSSHLVANLLDRLDRAGTYLDLLIVALLQRHVGFELAREGIAVTHGAEVYENLGDAIIGEHRDTVYIAEFAESAALEAGPYVAYQYLSPLVDADSVPLVIGLVPIRLELVDDQLEQLLRRTVARPDTFRERTLILIQQNLAGLVQILNSVLYERNAGLIVVATENALDVLSRQSRVILGIPHRLPLVDGPLDGGAKREVSGLSVDPPLLRARLGPEGKIQRVQDEYPIRRPGIVALGMKFDLRVIARANLTRLEAVEDRRRQSLHTLPLDEHVLRQAGDQLRGLFRHQNHDESCRLIADYVSNCIRNDCEKSAIHSVKTPVR